MLRLLALLAFLVLPAHGQEGPKLSYSGPGGLGGHWEFRSFIVSSEGSDTFNNGPPYDDLELTEGEGGVLTGTLTDLGETFPITGKATYKPDLVTVALKGEFVHEGETYIIEVFGYLSPLWANADEQRTMIFGQTTRYPKASPETGMAANASFVAIQDF